MSEPHGNAEAGVERIVRLADHETTVWDGGTGEPPVLLIHALGLDHQFWRAVFPPLAAVSRVVAYDVRGHGRARGAPPPRDIAYLADDARRLLDALGVEQADVYGSSYGGSIAQQLAFDAPDRVRSLALIATAARWPADEMRRRAAAAEAEGMDAQVPSALQRWFLPESIAADPWFVRYARDHVRSARVADWAGAWRAMATFDVRDRLPGLTVPTLVLSGRQDQSSTPQVMRELADLCGNSELHSIDPGTHMAVLEQPAAVSAKLLAFRVRVSATCRS